LRVFLDTNVLVSAFATRGICADLLRIVIAEHALVVSETVLRELRRVLGDKFGVPHGTIEAAEEFLRREGDVIDAAAPLGIELCDPDDVAILEEAVAGNVRFLVTGDRDLLQIAGQAPVSVVSPRGFWDALRLPRDPPKREELQYGLET